MGMSAIKDAIYIPPLHLGTDDEVRRLAVLRGLSSEGIKIAQDRGLLRFGKHFGQDAWFVLDGTFKNIQARRMDGEPWSEGCKALSLKNSQGNWPIGLYESLEYPNIAIVEGGPDLIAAHHLLWAEECENRWGVIAMLGASASFPTEAAKILKGKKLKIYYHYDKNAQGALGAYRWHHQLGLEQPSKHFCCCGPVQLQGGGIGKDLNDQAHISGDEFEELRAENKHYIFNI